MARHASGFKVVWIPTVTIMDLRPLNCLFAAVYAIVLICRSSLSVDFFMLRSVLIMLLVHIIAFTHATYGTSEPPGVRAYA